MTSLFAAFEDFTLGFADADDEEPDAAGRDDDDATAEDALAFEEANAIADELASDEAIAPEGELGTAREPDVESSLEAGCKMPSKTTTV